MEPTPPPITIVDPNDPAGTADLLDTGPDPWRPSRRQKVAVLASALVAALVAGTVVQVRDVRHEHALDDAALRDVTLAVSPDQTRFDLQLAAEVVPSVQLVNQGTLPLRVISLGLVGPSYPEAAQDTLLLANSALGFDLPSQPCTPAVLTEAPDRLRVRVRTGRGDEAVRTLPLPPDLASSLAGLLQRRCGYLPPEEALQSEVLRAVRDGRDVLVTVVLRNASVQPLTLTGFVPNPGLRIHGALPLTLPERAGPSAPMATAEIELRLRVTDCREYAEFAAYSEGGWALPVLVTSAGRRGTAVIPLVGGYDSQSEPADAAHLLLAHCPGYFTS